MSVTELKTKILTAFENEIRVSFLLIVKYHVMNICSNCAHIIKIFIFPFDPIFHAINFPKLLFLILDKK